MAKYARDYRYDTDNPSDDGEKKELAAVGDESAGGDPGEGSAGIDYRRLIDEQRFELEELKRAARDASPSSSSRHPEQASSAAADVTAAVAPPTAASDGESQQLPPPPPASNPRPHVFDWMIYGRRDSGKNFEVSRQSLEAVAAGRSGDHDGSGTAEGARYVAGAGGDGRRRYSKVDVPGSSLLAAATRDERKQKSGDGDAASPLGVHFAGGSGARAAAGGQSGAGESNGDGGRLGRGGLGAGPSAIADEALASLERGLRSGGGGLARGWDGAQRRKSSRSSATADTSASTAVSTACGGDEARPVGVGGGRVALDQGFAEFSSAGRNGDISTKRFYGVEGDAPPPLQAAPTAAKPPPPPLSTAAHHGRTPSTYFHARSTEAVTVTDDGCGGRDAAVDATSYRHDAGRDETRRLTDQRGGGHAGGDFLRRRPFPGSSWAASGGGWGVNGGLDRGGLATLEGRETGGDTFRSASWADKLVVKREEQSVLVKQLERELASTVSALKDERKDRRNQTEALKRKLGEVRGAVGDREAELERRERMNTALMTELEALRSRCDRLSASREERAEEADKMVARLREDNRELEARLRQADAAAAEAREARAGADAERVRMERDLHSALAKATAAERRVEEQAEASTGAAEVAARELRESRAECEGLRSELESSRRRLEEEEPAGLVGPLRAQVADLERLLATADQRGAALEARLGLLERELVEAEGGEVEARARLRWALVQLGETVPAAGAAADAVGAAATVDGGLQRGGNTTAAEAAAAAVAAAAATGLAADEDAAGSELVASGRPHVGGLDRPGGRAVVPERAAGDTVGCRQIPAAGGAIPTAGSPPRHGLLSPTGGAARPTRGSLTTPPSPAKASDVGLDEGKSLPEPLDGEGSSDGGWVREADEAEQEQEDEEEFREPNWRSMLPVLFPPGWREREIAAAATAAARAGGRGTDGTAAVDEAGMRAEASVGRSAGEVDSRQALGWSRGLSATLHGGDRDSSDDPGDERGEERGAWMREQGAGVSHDGSKATGDGTRVETRRRQQSAEGEEGPGGVTPSVYGYESGVYCETSEGRVQAALDHLTEEEERFAFEGGVETEYGEWQYEENGGLGEESGSEEGGYDEERLRVQRYGHDGALDYHDDGDRGDIPFPVPGSDEIAALQRISRGSSSDRCLTPRAGEARRKTLSLKAAAGPRVQVQVPKTSGRGAGVAWASYRHIDAHGARGDAGSRYAVASVVGRRRSQSGRSAKQYSTGVRSAGGQGHRVESALIGGKRRGPGAPIVSAGGGMGGGGARRPVSARVPVLLSPAATKSVPKIRVGRPPSHPRSTAGGGALVPGPRCRNQSDSRGVDLRRVAVQRRGLERASAGNGQVRGSMGGRRLDADVSLGSAPAKPRVGRSLQARSNSGAGAGRSVGGTNGGPGLGRGVVPRRHRRDDGHLRTLSRGSFSRVQDGSVTDGGAAKASKSTGKAAVGGAGVGMSASCVSAGVRSGRSSGREYVSLMRRRKDRGGLGSSLASRAGAGRVSERRVGTRGAGGSSGGTVDSSVCSSRAWKP